MHALSQQKYIDDSCSIFCSPVLLILFQLFPHCARELLKHNRITAVIEDSSVRKKYDYRNVFVFKKLRFKCFSFALKSEAGVSKILRFEECFR